MNEILIQKAEKNLRDTLRDALQVSSNESCLVIYDEEAPLTQIMVEAYRRALPSAEFYLFESTKATEILEKISALKPSDAVILVQSMNFRLNEFRIRIELFQRGLKTIEHIHLARMSEDQFEAYIDTLAYDPNYYRPLGRALKEKLDSAKEVVVECGDRRLVWSAGMEDSKLNVGDYSGMKNVGGTFPIGEVFTESKEIVAVNGESTIFGFATEDHMMKFYEPFRVVVTDGILTAPDGPADFQRILDIIKADDQVMVREFGLGLNPAVGKHRMINDITAYERQLGLHLSLGEKHAMYPKPGLGRKNGRYHVDVFIDVDRITVDGEPIFEAGKYMVS